MCFKKYRTVSITRSLIRHIGTKLEINKICPCNDIFTCGIFRQIKEPGNHVYQIIGQRN